MFQTNGLISLSSLLFRCVLLKGSASRFVFVLSSFDCQAVNVCRIYFAVVKHLHRTLDHRYLGMCNRKCILYLAINCESITFWCSTSLTVSVIFLYIKIVY